MGRPAIKPGGEPLYRVRASRAAVSALVTGGGWKVRYGNLHGG